MKTEILVIGRHEEILQILLRLVNSHEQWHGIGTNTDQDAIRLFRERRFDIVLLSCGIDTVCENNLCENFRKLHPAIIIIQHYGGGSGLLTNEILQALEERERAGQRT